MVSFKFLAVLILVAFVTVDVEACSNEIKERYAAKLEQAREGFEKLREVAEGQVSYDIICEDFEQLPEAINHFFRKGEKADCEEAPTVTVENEEDDEEEGEEVTVVRKACKGMEKRFICGFKNFASKVDEFKEKMEDAIADNSCKDLDFESIQRGLFLLSHLEKNKKQLMAAKVCDRIKEKYETKLKQASEGIRKLEQVVDGQESYDNICDKFQQLPQSIKYFIRKGKKEEDCKDEPTVTEQNVQDEEKEVEGTDAPRTCSKREKKLICGFKNFAGKVTEFQGQLEKAVADNSCKGLKFKSIQHGLFLLSHLDKSKAQLDEVREKEKQARKEAIAAKELLKEKRKEEKNAEKSAERAERKLKKLEKEEEKLQKKVKGKGEENTDGRFK